MKIFFDMEFTGLHQNTTPISIGMVAENGKAFYGQFTDYDKSQVDDWIQEHVIDNLHPLTQTRNARPDVYEIDGDTNTIKKAIEDWLDHMSHDGTLYGDQRNIYPDKYPRRLEMWGDCLAYDWILFCQMWGHAFKVPANVYYIPFDLCTLMKIKGIDPDISREAFALEGTKKETAAYGEKHNALWDALIIKACYEKLTNPPTPR